jgi:hypothetical protein
MNASMYMHSRVLDCKSEKSKVKANSIHHGVTCQEVLTALDVSTFLIVFWVFTTLFGTVDKKAKVSLNSMVVTFPLCNNSYFFSAALRQADRILQICEAIETVLLFVAVASAVFILALPLLVLMHRAGL